MRSKKRDQFPWLGTILATLFLLATVVVSATHATPTVAQNSSPNQTATAEVAAAQEENTFDANPTPEGITIHVKVKTVKNDKDGWEVAYDWAECNSPFNRSYDSKIGNENGASGKWDNNTKSVKITIECHAPDGQLCGRSSKTLRNPNIPREPTKTPDPNATRQPTRTPDPNHTPEPTRTPIVCHWCATMTATSVSTPSATATLETTPSASATTTATTGTTPSATATLETTPSATTTPGGGTDETPTPLDTPTPTHGQVIQPPPDGSIYAATWCDGLAQAFPHVDKGKLIKTTATFEDGSIITLYDSPDGSAKVPALSVQFGSHDHVTFTSSIIGQNKQVKDVSVRVYRLTNCTPNAPVSQFNLCPSPEHNAAWFGLIVHGDELDARGLWVSAIYAVIDGKLVPAKAQYNWDEWARSTVQYVVRIESKNDKSTFVLYYLPEMTPPTNCTPPGGNDQPTPTTGTSDQPTTSPTDQPGATPTNEPEKGGTSGVDSDTSAQGWTRDQWIALGELLLIVLVVVGVPSAIVWLLRRRTARNAARG